MILKTLEHILSEYRNKGYIINQYDESCQILINGDCKNDEFIIAVSMFQYFGKEINVYKAQNKKYEYYTVLQVRKWWFKEDWFVNINLLEDDLFEI